MMQFKSRDAAKPKPAFGAAKPQCTFRSPNCASPRCNRRWQRVQTPACNLSRASPVQVLKKPNSTQAQHAVPTCSHVDQVTEPNPAAPN
ncbi:hypothetical protein FF1_002967 [Malus domestica]